MVSQSDTTMVVVKRNSLRNDLEYGGYMSEEQEFVEDDVVDGEHSEESGNDEDGIELDAHSGISDQLFNDMLRDYRKELSLAEDDAEDTSEDQHDDQTADEEDVSQRPKNRAEERVVQKLQRSQAEVVSLKKELNDLKSSMSVQDRYESTGDVVDDIINMISSRKGIKKESKQDLLNALYEVVTDISTEAAILEGLENDPDFKQKIDSRKERKFRDSTTRQIEELRRENARKEQELRIQADMNAGYKAMGEFLINNKAEDRYPELFSAESDVISTIFEGLQELQRNGHQLNDENYADTIEYVCKTINDEHRRLYEKISEKKGRKSQGVSNQGERSMRGIQRNGSSNRREERSGPSTVTASKTLSSRVVPTKKESTDDFADILKEYKDSLRRSGSRTGR